MQTMKQHLILMAVASAAIAHAQTASPTVQQVADAGAAAPGLAVPAKTSLRQLSAQERAELRRQLYQFSRTAGKGS